MSDPKHPGYEMVYMEDPSNPPNLLIFFYVGLFGDVVYAFKVLLRDFYAGQKSMQEIVIILTNLEKYNLKASIDFSKSMTTEDKSRFRHPTSVIVDDSNGMNHKSFIEINPCNPCCGNLTILYTRSPTESRYVTFDELIAFLEIGRIKHNV